jgi:hypothetical protein
LQNLRFDGLPLLVCDVQRREFNPHKETRLVALGLFSMFDSGASLTTTMGEPRSSVAICVLSWTLYMRVFGSAGNVVLTAIILRWENTSAAGLYVSFPLCSAQRLVPCRPPDMWRQCTVVMAPFPWVQPALVAWKVASIHSNVLSDFFMSA